MVLGVLLTLFDYVTTSADYFYTQTENYHFAEHLLTNVTGAFLGGILGGVFIVFYSGRKQRKLSFISYVLLNSIVTFVIIFIISFVISLSVIGFTYGKSIFSGEVFSAAVKFVFGIHVLRCMVFWFFVTMGTTSVLRISEKFGPGLLQAMLMGKYHQPVEEERIFMFLDLKSSTPIAERLGHRGYFKMLNDFYSDITNSIRYNKGEIYQYVGDEVVVTWQLKKGLSNNNCLNCFFEAQNEIKKYAEKYLTNYSIVPEFKAGMHVGPTTAGEIGVLKKEIAFSGDVLNTTSRIQNQCNKYKSELLISEELLNKLDLNNKFTVLKIGEIELRGKLTKTRLYSIRKNM